jgi:hypothetical protein
MVTDGNRAKSHERRVGTWLAVAHGMHLSQIQPSILFSRVGHAFDIPTMIAGFGCHQKGVTLEAVSAGSARVLVKSQKKHTVELKIARGKLLWSCSCPAESMGKPVCQHTWAALLEVDKQGALAELRNARTHMPLERASSSPEPPLAPAKKKKARR